MPSPRRVVTSEHPDECNCLACKEPYIKSPYVLTGARFTRLAMARRKKLRRLHRKRTGPYDAGGHA